MNVSPDNASNIEAYNDADDDFLRSWDPDGDAGRKYVLNPTIFRMLGPLEGQKILDAGCGQGYLCRLMARQGAVVTGVDSSLRLLEYARRAEDEQPLGVHYCQRDLSRLGDFDRHRFDAVVANMVFLDIADWESAMSNCLSVLRADGLFVFSLLHPCWAPDALETWSNSRRVELTEYLKPYQVTTTFGVNYHRPLSYYLDHLLRSGATIREIAEPLPSAFDDSADSHHVGAHVPNFVLVSALMSTVTTLGR